MKKFILICLAALLALLLCACGKTPAEERVLVSIIETEELTVDDNGKWVLGGKAMLFQSNREGYKNHGGHGSHSDYFIMFFDIDAYDRFLMTKEEKGIYDEANKPKKTDKTDKSDKAGKPSAPATTTTPTPPGARRATSSTTTSVNSSRPA